MKKIDIFIAVLVVLIIAMGVYEYNKESKVYRPDVHLKGELPIGSVQSPLGSMH